MRTSAASGPTTITSCARGCGRTDPIADAGLRAVVEDVARRTGYRVDDHRLEMFGLCPACQKREGTAATKRARAGGTPAAAQPADR